MHLITSWLGKEDYFLMWLIWSRYLNLVYHFPVLNQGHSKSKTVSVLVYTAASGSTSLCAHLSVFVQIVPQLCVTVKSRATPGFHRKKTQLFTPERRCETGQIHVFLKDQGHKLPGMLQQKWWHRQSIFCCSCSALCNCLKLDFQCLGLLQVFVFQIRYWLLHLFACGI